jgi:hypothetical protein
MRSHCRRCGFAIAVDEREANLVAHGVELQISFTLIWLSSHSRRATSTMPDGT